MNDQLATLVIRPQSLTTAFFTRELAEAVKHVEATGTAHTILLASDNGTHAYPVLADVRMTDSGKTGIWLNEEVLTKAGIHNVPDLKLRQSLHAILTGPGITVPAAIDAIIKAFKEYTGVAVK